MRNIFSVMLLILVPGFALASVSPEKQLDLTSHTIGYMALGLFVIAYILVMVEEITHLRKSKPVLLVAGLIWALIGYVYATNGMTHIAEAAVRHNLVEYAELMLFLLVAMTYINSMAERQVFEALRAWLINKGFGFRKVFWLTGILAFFISPVADNLTTALLMGAVVTAVGGDNKKFMILALINIVVAANAGGAFSPFGDITTLMVWQKGIIEFGGFFSLFIPSVINFLVPAVIMSFAIPNAKPTTSSEHIPLKRGAKTIVFMFLLTIVTAVSFHNFLHLPPVLGMMTGLAYLQFFGYYLKKTHYVEMEPVDLTKEGIGVGDVIPFDIFNKVARAEWDTLLFFYGVILAVGGLGFIGYLSMASEVMYTQWGPLTANIAIGLLSAIVDNIPVMFAVLTMNPEMTQGHWLLVTLTAGVGGSLLSIGSAAGVALMGQARGIYTFFGHLKWSWAIGLGYAASIWVHMWLNASLF